MRMTYHIAQLPCNTESPIISNTEYESLYRYESEVTVEAKKAATCVAPFVSALSNLSICVIYLE